MEIAEHSQQECKTVLDEARKARRDHHDLKPGLVDALFTRGAAYREWLEKDRLLASAVNARETELTQARAECSACQNELLRLDEETAALKAEIDRQENLLSRQHQLRPITWKFGPAFPDTERWIRNPDERELSSPWADESWNRARTQVLIEALHLHRTFVECVPDKVRRIFTARWTFWEERCHRQRSATRLSSPRGRRSFSSFRWFRLPLPHLTGCSLIAAGNHSAGF